MTDRLGRTINYLRLSVVDRCNLRCFYCMPSRGVEPLPHGDILTYEEINRICRLLASGLGIKKIRLTGGEPLVRKHVTKLIRQLNAIDGIEDLVLTTNAILLAPMAEELKEAGISRVNISLDTLKPDRFRKICRGGDIHKVLEGIEASKRIGLEPVKINVVLLKNCNEDEVADFIRFADQNDLEVRFIEFMKVGHSSEHWLANFVRAAEVAAKMEKEFELEPLPAGRTTVRLYRLKNTEAKVGFISGASGDLCEKCNRLRLTSDGCIRPCLMLEDSLNVRDMMRSGSSDEELLSSILKLVEGKGIPRCYETSRDMYSIGG